MPTYELTMMLRTMPKQELVSTLKRTALAIFDRNGSLRAIENLGHRRMPFRVKQRGHLHTECNYFVYKLDAPTQAIADLKEEYSRDVDIIRNHFYKVEEPEKYECTLEEETQPPAYRKEVQEMITLGKKQVNPFTKHFKYNNNLNYYPFSK